MDWKLENIIPILKKSMKKDPKNDRPVSFSSVPGKVMGKIILEVLKNPWSTTVIGHSPYSSTR